MNIASKLFGSLAVVLALCGTVQAQVVQVYSPPPVAVVPSMSYYAPAPVVAYSAPAPSVSCNAAAPSVSYYAPASSVSYYAPAPVVTYASPVVAAPGIYTTRTYYGFGIFRPRGMYTETYYSPR